MIFAVTMAFMVDGLSLFHSHVSDGNFSYNYGDREEIKSNREKFLYAHGIRMADCVGINPRHGTGIAGVGSIEAGRGMLSLDSGLPADALITDDKRISLFILTADCQPVVLFDPARQVMCLAHVSRHNSAENMLPQIVSELRVKYSCGIKDISCYIGPCIHSQSYLLSADQFGNQELWHPYLTPVEGGLVTLDLVRFSVDRLVASGIEREKIEVSPADTYTDSTYFSHRRSVDQGELEGRFATVVRLQ